MDLREPLRETVAEVGYRPLVSVGPTATVREAVRVMREREVGCVLMVEGERLRGIFTERDLVARVLAETRALDTPLADVVTREPVTVSEDEPIGRALARMCNGHCRHLPVLDRIGRPVGSLSVKRAIHFLGECMPEAVYNLPLDPNRFPSTVEGA